MEEDYNKYLQLRMWAEFELLEPEHRPEKDEHQADTDMN